MNCVLRTCLLFVLICTSVASIAQPTLSSSLTPPPVCNHTYFDYTPMSATPGTTFDWVRPFMTGISLLPTTGSGNIHEILINSTNVAITVVYTYTLTAGSSTNVQNVSVIVEPTPVLISPPSISVCSGVLLNYTPLSLTPGVDYTWTRDSVIGITNSATTGVGNISEALTSPGHVPVLVPYHFILSIPGTGCMDTQTVFATVNTIPDAGSVTGASAICTGDTVWFHNTMSGGTWSSHHGFASVASSGIVTGISAGLDTIMYIVSNACGTDTAWKAIDVTFCITKVHDVNSNSGDVSAYPNPTNGTFTLKTPGTGKFALLSFTGKLLAEYPVKGKANTISLPADAAPGIYMGRFNGDDGTHAILKLIYNIE